MSEYLVQYIQRHQIDPLVSKTDEFRNSREAQQDFVDKKYRGKLVLIPAAVAALAQEEPYVGRGSTGRR